MPLPEYVCAKCHHPWTPRVADPLRCPNPACQTIYWREMPAEKPAQEADDEPL